MHALIMQNRRNDALAQFKHVTETYQKYLGVQAPPAIQDFYREIVRADQTLDKDMESISTDLKEGDDDQGAFICDYAIFKDIFRLQIRSLERYHMTTYLAMVRLNGVDDSVVEPFLFDETMQRLLAVLRDSLRRGDTVTRYSASQYAVLLQGATVASIKNILDRIVLSFYKETAASSIRIDCRYTPLLSEADGDLAALS
ncbi:hypothetical protein FACS1894196_4630 [Clostridia bacterium]|nr:hypothetical protein FACS1894196_4630 [Clostridia bacterium]